MPRSLNPYLAGVLFCLCALALPAQPVLSVTQPTGPGSFQLSVTGVGTNAELFNLISLFPHNPTGMGPLFGLSLTGSNLLVDQLLEPLPTPPFHVLAAGTSYDFSFTVGAIGFQIPVDVVTIEWSPVTGIVGISNVVNITLDF